MRRGKRPTTRGGWPVRMGRRIELALLTTFLLSGCVGEPGEGGLIELSFGHVGAPGSLFAASPSASGA